VETSQRVALAVLQNRNPSPELAALAELCALIDVLLELGLITTERGGNEPGAMAVGAFCEALDNANAIVAQRMRERVKVR
jgi:hypothetical protein